MTKRPRHKPPKQPSRPRGAAKKVWQRIYLREWREFRELTVEKLAEDAGVSPGLISQIENKISAGSADSLEKLALALKISVGELLDVKPEPGGAIMRMWVPDKDRGRARRLIDALSKEPT